MTNYISWKYSYVEKNGIKKNSFIFPITLIQKFKVDDPIALYCDVS